MRVAAQAVAGFIGTTTALLPRIGSLVTCGPGEHLFVDPCAGEGEAIFTLAGVMCPPEKQEGKLYLHHRAAVFACEMEATRFEKLKARAQTGRDSVAHGDAFRLKLGAESSRATILYLNPPFAPDRRCGRLEEKWLRRFGPVLRAGGALLFVLPYYALDASAETLARDFEVAGCFRFDPWPDEYKRVIVVAQRRAPLLMPDPEVVARVRAWGASPEAIPMLPEAGLALLEVAGVEHRDWSWQAWELQQLDAAALCEQHTPWHVTDRGGRLVPVTNVMPANDFASLLAPRFPVATVPRPAHLAAGLASGVLSGARLRPTDPSSPLPEILVRGTFRRRFVTVQDKMNKDGDKVGEIQAQVPELEIVALDLRAGSFHTLKSSVEKTGARRVADMTAGDLLAEYGSDLLATLRDRCPALYDPGRPGDVFALPEIPGARRMFTAQAHTARAAARLLADGEQSAILLGEIGTGKTTVSVRASIAALTANARRVIAMTPPHVAPGFAAQVPVIWPGARAVHLETVTDVDAFMADRSEGLVVGMLSREDAKLGHERAGITGRRCPRCEAPVLEEPDELARTKARCGARQWEPTGPLGVLAVRVAEAIHAAAPDSVSVQAILSERVAERLRRMARNGFAVTTWPAAQARLRGFVPAVLAHVTARDAALPALVWLLVAIGDDALTAATARTLFVGSCFDPRSYGAGSDLREVARMLLLLAGPAGVKVVDEVRAWPLDRERYTYGQPSIWRQFDTHAQDLAAGKKVHLCQYGWTLEGRTVEQRDVRKAEIGTVGAAKRALEALIRGHEQRQTAPCGERLYQAHASSDGMRRYPLATYLAHRYRRQLRAGGFAVIADECFVAGTLVSGIPIEDLKVGDTIEAFDERTGRIATRRVVRLFRKRPAALVRVTSEGSSVVCTPTHPFWTQRGWVSAGDLNETDMLYVRQGNDEATAQGSLLLRRALHCGERLGGAGVARPLQRLHGDGGGLWGTRASHPKDRQGELRAGVLAFVPATEGGGSSTPNGHTGPRGHRSTDEGPEPDVHARGARASYDDAPGDGACAAGARRERPRAHGAAEDARRSPGAADGGDRADEQGPGLADSLQGGHRGSIAEAGDRGGRSESRQHQDEGEGREKGPVLAWARVDCVEVLEPGRDGRFGGVCPDRLVYNIEVEDLHTYVANGFVVHNCHEYAGESTAQAIAWKRMMCLRIPSICMTGSVMNGYAESLFNLLWYTCASFRAEFDLGDRADFVRTYGYVKQIVEQRDNEGQRVVYGSQSDRVQTVARESGQAPGVLPTLLLRHLLPRAVTLQMADIEGELPPARDIPIAVHAEGDLLAKYKTLETKLLAQIKRDRFDAERAGRLFGQLAELPGALDRLTVDVIGDEYVIAYPPSAGTAAGKTVVAVDALPVDTITPKERAMLDTFAAELAEGRNVVAFVWHLDLIPRLARLAGTLGRVAVLDCAKVPPGKRDAWVAKEIAKKTRIVFVNPVGVSTGLNSMVPYFSTDWWHENPACNPIVMRQAKGRTRRIGQTQEKRSYFPVYEGTAQAVAFKLLQHKAGIGEAADGLDATAALQAAGVGAVDITVAQDIGRALFEALTREPESVVRVAA